MGYLILFPPYLPNRAQSALSHDLLDVHDQRRDHRAVHAHALYLINQVGTIKFKFYMGMARPVLRQPNTLQESQSFCFFRIPSVAQHSPCHDMGLPFMVACYNSNRYFTSC
jgi:hypothetical protein